MSWSGLELSKHGNILQQTEGAALQRRGLGELIEGGRGGLRFQRAGIAAQRRELSEERAKAVEGKSIGGRAGQLLALD